MRARDADRDTKDLDIKRLFEVYARPLYAFLLYRTGDSAWSEDLVSETFERAMRGKRLFNHRRAGEKTWLYTIALNLLRDQSRRQAAETRALQRVGPPNRDDVFDASLQVPLRDEVLRGLAELAAEEREALALRYAADLGVREIAQVLRVPVTTVEGRIYRGLRKLRGHLDPGE